jgi:Xaa-Pro dipeptidase
MRAIGLDAILLFHQESMYYLFGYDQIGYWVYQTVLLPVDGEPGAVVRKVDEALIREPGLVGDIRVWFDDPDKDPIALTGDILKDRGMTSTRCRVGVEMKSHALLPYYYERLRSELGSSVTFVDASDLVTDLRTIKSPAEIALMRKAADIMDNAFVAGRNVLRPGNRECDVGAAIAHALYANGGDPPAVPAPIASGERTFTGTHGAPTERVMQHGEPATIEIGAAYKRYHAVGLRSAVLGRAETRSHAQSLHDSLVAGLAAGEALIKPGNEVRAVAARVLDALDELGVNRRGRHLGYGIGIGYPPTWLDSLRIKLTDPRTLDSGMTFFYMVGAQLEDGSGYLAVGDPVLVTSTGCEYLSALPRELWSD